ncbi:SAF domain-containing protein [Alicyclobacillus sp.]|uniref:NAD(P)H-dependent oxidoreductase n=1 Tax=Alicyclobacillus sp. TaxID=61169 RepID=UPI0025BE0677|nr:SAF domain-containing protein [Alicyclobacillus sp.]MCL6517471.1 NAD(P)-dependent oxidoreductase [Alicyclobacillus sp.]
MFRQGLIKRESSGKPIRVGFVGSGRMGTGAICQIAHMRGMTVSVIADIQAERAIRAFSLSGYRPDDVVVTNKLSTAADAVRQGHPVVTEDANLVPQLDVEVVVDATGSPELGARIAFQSIQHRRHIVMLNVESDVVIGPILHRMAQNAGVVYTVSSGDEPGLIAELYDRYAGLGLEVVAVGKTPTSLGSFDRYATPDSLEEEARALGVNPHFLVTFRDATKTMIEMACVSNYTGLVPDIRGMHGPIAGVEEIPRLFKLESEGGLLHRRGVVDYARPLMTPDGRVDFMRSVTPGVFLVVRTEHPQIQADLQYFDVVSGGDGYYLLYTPYHLVTTEIPISIAHAALYQHPTVVAKDGLVTEVIAAAKRDLHAGEVVTGQGESQFYALNDLYAVAKQERLVPFGLLPGARLRCSVKRDQVITYDMVDLRTDTVLYQLRQLQDSLFT